MGTFPVLVRLSHILIITGFTHTSDLLQEWKPHSGGSRFTISYSTAIGYWHILSHWQTWVCLSFISASLRDKLLLNYLVVNTSSYHSGANVLQINILLYAVVPYSCAHNQNDASDVCHVWLSFSLASDFSRNPVTLVTYFKDIFSFHDHGL